MYTKDEILSSHCRAIALGNNCLYDVSNAARERGIALPVALTKRVWREAVAAGWDEDDLSDPARLGVLLDELVAAIRGMAGAERVICFDVEMPNYDLVSTCMVTFKCVVGHDDDWKPCLTVMLWVED